MRCGLKIDQLLKDWQRLVVTLLVLYPLNLDAWTNGQLLIWMDSGLAQGLRPIAAKFKHDWGIEVTIDTPANTITRRRGCAASKTETWLTLCAAVRVLTSDNHVIC